MKLRTKDQPPIIKFFICIELTFVNGDIKKENHLIQSLLEPKFMMSQYEALNILYVLH